MNENSISIYYHPWSGLKDIFYEVEICKRSFARYVHQGRIISERLLNEAEIEMLTTFVGSISFPLKLPVHKEVVIIPNIESKLKIKTRNSNYAFFWNSKDSDLNKVKLKAVEKMATIVTGLLKIDFSNLNMPRYL